MIFYLRLNTYCSKLHEIKNFLKRNDVSPAEVEETLGNSYIDYVKTQFEGRKDNFYLTMLSTHFINSYMVSDIW